MNPITHHITTDQVQHLLKKLFKKPDLLLVVGSRTSIAELFVKDFDKFQFKNDWFTCECAHWHIHMKYQEVKKISFVEKVRHVEPKRVSYSIVFKGSNNHRLIQAYLRDDKKLFLQIKQMFEK